MTKRSLIHPTLKTAVASLDLEIEAEIKRYQHQKTGLVKQSEQTSQPEFWENTVKIAAREIPVICVDSTKINLLKQPWVVTSLVLTAIASGLLGATITDNPPTVQTFSTPPLVEGLNLAETEIDLNLQTLSRLPDANPQLTQQVIPTAVSTPQRQQQSELVNKLLPRLE